VRRKVGNIVRAPMQKHFWTLYLNVTAQLVPAL
jgi:hypothetical protein